MPLEALGDAHDEFDHLDLVLDSPNVLVAVPLLHVVDQYFKNLRLLCFPGDLLVARLLDLVNDIFDLPMHLLVGAVSFERAA